MKEWHKVSKAAKTVSDVGQGLLVLTLLLGGMGLVMALASKGPVELIALLIGTGIGLGVGLLVIAQIMYVRAAVERMASAGENETVGDAATAAPQMQEPAVQAQPVNHDVAANWCRPVNCPACGAQNVATMQEMVEGLRCTNCKVGFIPNGAKHK